MWRHAWKVGKDLLCNEKGFTMTSLVVISALAAAASIGTSQYSSSAQQTQAKKATGAAEANARSQAAKMQQAQDTATSQAQQTIMKKQRKAAHYGKTIFTSPMGLGTQASTARKTLLGQ